MPDKKETYFSPMVYTLRNGTDVVVFGTGGETHGGTLYVIQLHHLYRGDINTALPIHKDGFKGTLFRLSPSAHNTRSTVTMIKSDFKLEFAFHLRRHGMQNSVSADQRCGQML